MGIFKVRVVETASYEIEVEAENQEAAFASAEDVFCNMTQDKLNKCFVEVRDRDVEGI